jgi:hypothetical protein
MADLKTQLQSLVRLQTVDSEIYGLNREKDAKPEELKAIDAAFEAKKQHLSELEKATLDLQKQKKEAELELASKEEAAKKLQGQLYQLKTNKEYQVMLQQIQGAKADASLVEDKILGLMDRFDASKAAVEQEKQALQEEEKVFAGQKKQIQDRIKEIDDALSQLQAQRAQILPDIEPRLLPQYQRILDNREGLAIVSVRNNSCGGCNMGVPPQVINLIRMYERIIYCEVCNRMLYLEDDQSA